MKPNVRISCRQSLAVSLAALTVFSGLITTPATAGGGDVAAGLLGGLAVGTIVGSAVAQPRYTPPTTRRRRSMCRVRAAGLNMSACGTVTDMSFNASASASRTRRFPNTVC